MESKKLHKALMLHASSNTIISPEVSALLVTANNNNTLALLYNSAGIDIGYIIYAKVNSFSAYALIKYGIYPKYFHEWNEGKISLIYRVMIVNSPSHEIFFALRNFLKINKIFLYRKKEEFRIWRKRNEKFKKYI